MKDHIEELQMQIDAMSLAPSASSALLEATLEIFHRMKQEKVMQAVPLAHRIATAAFLACDSNACIAMSKLKRAFGNNILGRNITKARTALQIPHGTAHEKLNSLCDVCEISDTATESQAHYYVDLLSETSAMPSSIASASLYVAVKGVSMKSLTHNEIYHLTGCTEITQRKLIKILLRKLAPKTREERVNAF
jgi:transcription initiation factor TFIIIB Brf1 subunit/transcription initiation factor TFIIB